jgi:MFS family permease
MAHAPATPLAEPAPDAHAPSRLPPAARLFTLEGLCSIGGNLLQIGIFFYTNRRFSWGLKENFTLATVQGIVYVVGAMLAHALATRVGARRALVVQLAVLTLVALAPVVNGSVPVVVVALLVYTFVIGLCWPMIESLVAQGVTDPHDLSRRMAAYNVVWAGTAALTLAVNGAIIEYWPVGVFVITAVMHGLSALLLLPGLRNARPPEADTVTAPHPHLDPEPELLRVRTVALWLSRISVPASYALVYALSALLPSLATIRQLPIWAATLAGSVWLMSRWLTFLLLGFGTWWHTRPRSLLVAAWLMLAAFAAVAWQPSEVLFGSPILWVNLAWLVLCQVVIGVSIGLIYSASLYFGMVLSEGSTEHSGYHEALIGLGSILGPGAGAFAQWLQPGHLTPGVVAVASVLLLSTLVATGAAVTTRK